MARSVEVHRNNHFQSECLSNYGTALGQYVVNIMFIEMRNDIRPAHRKRILDRFSDLQGGSNMTGTDVARFTHK